MVTGAMPRGPGMPGRRGTRPGAGRPPRGRRVGALDLLVTAARVGAMPLLAAAAFVAGVRDARQPRAPGKPAGRR